MVYFIIGFIQTSYMIFNSRGRALPGQEASYLNALTELFVMMCGSRSSRRSQLCISRNLNRTTGLFWSVLTSSKGEVRVIDYFGSLLPG